MHGSKQQTDQRTHLRPETKARIDLHAQYILDVCKKQIVEKIYNIDPCFVDTYLRIQRSQTLLRHFFAKNTTLKCKTGK